MKKELDFYQKIGMVSLVVFGATILAALLIG